MDIDKEVNNNISEDNYNYNDNENNNTNFSKIYHHNNSENQAKIDDLKLLNNETFDFNKTTIINKGSKSLPKKSKIHNQLYKILYNKSLKKKKYKSNKIGDSSDDDEEEDSSLDNYDIEKDIYRFNILLLGEKNVGKTSIINKFLVNRFTNNIKPTLFTEFKIKTINFDENTVVDLKIYDTCGDKNLNNFTKNFFREINGIFLVFDYDNFNISLNTIKSFIKEINEIAMTKNIILVGNKFDLSNNKHNNKNKEIDKLIKEYNIGFISVSAKTNFNIKNMFIEMIKCILNNKNEILIKNNQRINVSENFRTSFKLNERSNFQNPSNTKEKCCLA